MAFLISSQLGFFLPQQLHVPFPQTGTPLHTRAHPRMHVNHVHRCVHTQTHVHTPPPLPSPASSAPKTSSAPLTFTLHCPSWQGHNCNNMAASLPDAHPRAPPNCKFLEDRYHVSMGTCSKDQFTIMQKKFWLALPQRGCFNSEVLKAKVTGCHQIH